MEGHLSKLRRWRMENGITLQEAADLSGLSEAMLSLAERGKRNLAPLTKVRVARCLGARVSELFEVDLPEEDVGHAVTDVYAVGDGVPFGGGEVRRRTTQEAGASPSDSTGVGR